MSRREDRGSDGRRHRVSGFDRGAPRPSPKRSRRDGNVEIGGARVENVSDKDRSVKDEKHHRRYEDVKPLEASLVKDDSKVESGTTRKEKFERENDLHDEGFRRASDRSRVSRPASHFQHDDRATVGQGGRILSRREDRGRGWWRDPREQQIDREGFKTTATNGQLKEDNRSWRHDGYFELEANPNRDRKRPSFREQKISSDPEKPDKTASVPVAANPQDREMRGHRDFTVHNNRSFERDREMKRSEPWSSSARDGGEGRYGRGRGGFSGGQQNYRSSGNRAEKWKHDLYSEANRSPTPPKNEEDHIAKVEALLSS